MSKLSYPGYTYAMHHCNALVESLQRRDATSTAINGTVLAWASSVGRRPARIYSCTRLYLEGVSSPRVCIGASCKDGANAAPAANRRIPRIDKGKPRLTTPRG
jgi:hypothetical protein